MGEEDDNGFDNGDSIPAAYAEIMEQIDEEGWDAMEWTRGYTLLHWAAKNNMADLCARFMAQGAHPLQQDDAGKNAFAYAKEYDADDAMEQLRHGPPDLDDVPRVRNPISSARRNSATVEAQLFPEGDHLGAGV